MKRTHRLLCAKKCDDFFCLLLFALLLSACSKLESYTPGEVSNEEAGDTFVPAQYWGLKQVSTTVVDVPFLSSFDALAAQSTSYFVLEWRQEGDTVYQDETLCLTDISEVVGMSTIVPDQFYEYHGFQTRVAELDSGVVGASYLAPDNLSVYGADLEDPWTDPLPDSPSDPTEIDSDKDGHPGFTSVLTGWLGDGYAEVYVAQRTITTMSGTLIRNDRIEGYVYTDIDQSVLGASEGDEWAAADGFDSSQDPDPTHNFFLMQALDKELTCDELVKEEADIFSTSN